MAATTAHASANVLVRHAVARGIPASTAAGWLGLPAPELEQPGWLPIPRVLDAWLTLRNELSDSSVAARAARGWTLAHHGLYGFYVSTAPTVRDALAAAIRMIRLCTERGSWRLVEERDVVRCVWSWRGQHTPGHALLNEVIVSAFARGIRELAGAPPLRVELMHRAPSRSDHDTLLECDVRFARPETAIVVARGRMAIAPRSANPPLHGFLGELARRALDELAPIEVHERASRLVAERLRERAEVPALPEVARNLGMSERSLRRRLAGERVSFRALRGRAQVERAEHLLAQSDASLGEIALACGFADASAFGRAWRRHHGEAPSRSRRRRA